MSNGGTVTYATLGKERNPGTIVIARRLMLIYLRVPLAAAMVAEASCNLTPRHPPSQVLDNLPEIGG